MKTNKTVLLQEALDEVIKRLESPHGFDGQMMLYANSLHPFNDDMTFLDYLYEVKASTLKAKK